MRAHQAKDREELTHEDVYGHSQLKADMFNTVCVAFGTNLLPLPAAGFQASSSTTRESELDDPERLFLQFICNASHECFRFC